MLTLGLMLLWFAQPPASDEAAMIRAVVESGRVVALAERPDDRVTTKPVIAPGQPPLLSFRYYQGQTHHHFGNSDLMLDDAGH